MSRFSDPEQVLTRWLDAIVKKDYVKAYKYSQLTWKAINSKSKLKTLFENMVIHNWKIISSERIAEANQKITIEAEQPGATNQAEIQVICETGPYKASVKGRWGVNPISALKDVSIGELQGAGTKV
jgi:hypothetical protein